MMSVAIFKITTLLPCFGIMALMVKKLKEAEEDLLLQKISWQEYEILKQGTLGVALILFVIGMMICAL